MNLPFADEILFRYVSGRATRREPIFDSSEHRIFQRVLLVLTTGLGDAVLSTPAIRAIRAAMPDANIQLFCRRGWVPLFVADPDLSGVIPYHGKYREFLATLNRLREFSPQLTVILHGNDPDILPLVYLARSEFIVRVPTRGTRYQFLLSNRERPEDASTVPGLHYIENRLRILDTLGISVVSTVPRVHLPARANQVAESRLRRLCDGRPFWVLHPFAADPYKSWPLDKVLELVTVAKQRWPGFDILLTGGARDRRQLNTLPAVPNGVHVVAGEFEISEMAAIMARAACVVAPDTGILHLGAALGRPVVGLYAPTSPALVGPRGVRNAVYVIERPRTCDPCLEKQCPFTPNNCMDQIATSEVINALQNSLDRAC